MTRKAMTTGVAASAALGVVAATILGFVWAAAWSGFTLSVLWGWFVVPVFSLPALSVAQAYGIALVVRTAKGWDTRTDKNADSFGTLLGRAFMAAPLVSGVSLLFGWVAKSFV
ncbi:hypothetical protein [Comamonas sp. B21-038]|uniref:hypothetical protein n=1 Tax=Comamonas sp. B21-038 TaxID=2918299 RepID=UPI001EFA7B07|nr:hypothetical protein [Comamonas sp. B21-038]ULR87407.1 hypothetical protein MJ205_13125 [Comamonas sp. B21-038]